MATVQQPGERYLEFDEYIDFQLDKARNSIKWTDILAAVAGVAALVIGYLVLFVAADHWLFDGGVPQTIRIAALCLVAAVAVGWIGWKVVWPYLRRVNDLYAARMLEEAEPSLRGSLFGLVDLRRAGRPPAEEVRLALEKRAATTLSAVDVDSALDRRPLMRTSYVLLGIVLVACAYAVLSPKRVAPSIVRALFPTSAATVATRTEIIEVKPGDVAVLAGTQLDVSVMIRGEAPERVVLYYSTSDRRFADEPVEMRLHDETTREYRAALVGDAGRGLTQDLTYRIEANDDGAGPFAVTVDQPPAATVTSVLLQYPAYMGLEPSVRDAPPIDAIEGTNVTLTAKANHRLKSAKLVFADDERFLAKGEEVPMRVGEDGVTLTAAWKLAIRSDGTSPTFYRIECRDTDGKTNPNPAVYPIAIRPDQPPEITLHAPKSDLERPANAVIPLLVTARDPDFRLRELTLRIEKQGQELPERTVLWEGSQPEAAVRHDWDLAPLGLKPGDIVSFYVQARDNREPEFNRRNTPKLNITITEPVSQEEVEKQLAEDRQRQEQELAEAEQNEAATERPEQPEGQETTPMPGESTEPTGEHGEQGEDQQKQPTEAGESGEKPGEASASKQEDGGEQSDAPVNNDGSQDDEVLRKLLQRQREQQEQEPQPVEKGGAGDQAKRDGASEPKQEDAEQAGSKQPGEKGEEQQSDANRQEPGQGGDQQTGRDGVGDSQGEGGAGDRPREGANQSGTSRNQSGTKTEPSDGEENRNGSASGASQSKPSENRPDPSNPARSRPAGPGEPSEGTETPADPSAADAPAERSQGEGTNDAGRSRKPEGEADPTRTTSEKPGESAAPSPQPGDPAQDGSQDATETPQNGADGNRTGAQPKPSEDGSPSATDDERMASEFGRPQTNDSPPGATERNPGEGRPDQRSRQPDSGEGGTGQPNADGTPDGQPGPGDAGTQPGAQQKSDQPTGRPGAQGEGRDGQPGEGSSSADQSGQNERGASGQPNESGGAQGGNNETSGQPDGESQGTDGAAGQQGNGGQQNSGTGQSGEGSQQGENGGDAGAGENRNGQQSDNGSQRDASNQQGESQEGAGQQGDGSSQDGGQGGKQGGQSEQGGQGGQSGQGSQAGQGGQGGKTGGAGGSRSPGSGGTPSGDSPEGSGAAGDGGTAEPDAANPEYAKQATDLVLKRLEEDLRRGEVDPKLLEELGWTEEDMRRFADRLRKNLSEPTGGETPQEIARRQEFEHMLENLRLGDGPAARQGRTERVKDVGDIGTANPQVPSEYRDAFEAFTRSVAGRRQAEGKKK